MTNQQNTTEGNVQPDIREQIMASFIKCKLMKGRNPESVYSFAVEHGISESDFYSEFASFEALEREIWKGFLERTLNILTKSTEYGSYSVKEKLLAFFYTILEVWRENRSYILLEWNEKGNFEFFSGNLKSARETFLQYIKNLTEEGINTGEIKKRPLITERYGEILWFYLLFVLRFWIKDDSKNFEKTDVLIEKSMKLIFELFQEGPLDSAIDLVKFLYQNR